MNARPLFSGCVTIADASAQDLRDMEILVEGRFAVGVASTRIVAKFDAGNGWTQAGAKPRNSAECPAAYKACRSDASENCSS